MRNKTSAANRGAGINTAEHRSYAGEKTARHPCADNQGKSVAELLPATGEVGTAYTDRAGTRFPPAQRGFGGISLHKLCGLFVFLGDLQNALRSAISGQQKQNS